MAKNEKRPSWFKVFLHQKPLFQAVPDDVLGRAVKGAMDYFDTGQMPELGQMETIVFASLKPYVDESFEDYRQSVDLGRNGSKKRWSNKNSPPIAPLYPPHSPPIGVLTEAEADAEADTEEDAEAGMAAEPPLPLFSPPSVEEVGIYCKDKGYGIDPERFVDYYTSIGWRVGKNPMKDWKAAVRAWNRKESRCGGESEHSEWNIGTVL